MSKKPNPEAVLHLFLLRGFLQSEAAPAEAKQKLEAALLDAREKFRALRTSHGEEEATIAHSIVMLEDQCGMLPPA